MSFPPPAPTVHPLGEAAWTVQLGDRVDPELHRHVLALASRIAAAEHPGVRELVPGYAALTVRFDPRQADAAGLRDWLATVATSGAPLVQGPTPRPLREIPVRYDGADLDWVAEQTGLTREAVVQRHCGRVYRVYLLGFAPGFAYLGELDPALVLARRVEPRARVPAGAVAIAGAQTAVYPLATPGGWHLIGSTSLALFDPARDPPALLATGDRVRFVPQ